VSSTFIEEPLRVHYDHLNDVVSAENRFIKALAILASSADLLDQLLDLLSDETRSDGATWPVKLAGTRAFFQNCRGQCSAFVRTASYLQQRTQTTGKLLAETLSLRAQVVAGDQSTNMLRLNKSAVFITTLTLVYLPASFLAGFFGTNFFALDTESYRLVGSSMIWIYVAASVVLTTVTFIFYYWLLQRDDGLFRHLVPKVRLAGDLKSLVRRFTRNHTAGSGGAEINPFPV